MKIYLPQNSLAIRSVCYRRWQIKLTGFSAESSVWWDPKLRAGEHFDDMIEKALHEAKCVLVMWSNLSVNSEYVKAEATEALEQKKLVPIKIENVSLPFRFKKSTQRTCLIGMVQKTHRIFGDLSTTLEQLFVLRQQSAKEQNLRTDRNLPQAVLRKRGLK